MHPNATAATDSGSTVTMIHEMWRQGGQRLATPSLSLWDQNPPPGHRHPASLPSARWSLLTLGTEKWCGTGSNTPVSQSVHVPKWAIMEMHRHNHMSNHEDVSLQACSTRAALHSSPMPSDTCYSTGSKTPELQNNQAIMWSRENLALPRQQVNTM